MEKHTSKHIGQLEASSISRNLILDAQVALAQGRIDEEHARLLSRLIPLEQKWFLMDTLECNLTAEDLGDLLHDHPNITFADLPRTIRRRWGDWR